MSDKAKVDETKTEVSEKKTEHQNTEVAMVKQSGIEGYDLSELMADSGLGSENVGAKDIAIPYLGILQGLSPQVTEGKPEYVEGARPSMFFNNVTGAIFEGRKEGIIIVPCHYKKVWNVWMTREAGGGLIDVYEDDSVMKDTVKDDKNRFVIKDNPNLVVYETAIHYILHLDMLTGEIEKMVLSLKSTGLKHSRKFNHAIDSAKIPGHPTVTAPRFFYPYRVKTILEEGNGNSWWSPEFDRMHDPVAKPVYNEGKAYYELAKAGNVKVSQESPESPSAATSDAGDGEIPF